VREHIFPASISNLNESLLLFKGEGKKKRKKKKKKKNHGYQDSRMKK
jgi:hypothetical protein